MRRSVITETRYEAAALQATKESERLEELATQAHDGNH
jgi:hypothetical protein